MASNEVVVKLDADNLIAELKKAQELLSEERIRQIVREEIEETQKRQNSDVRSHGPHLGYEVK
jgi:hypothetical protein